MKYLTFLFLLVNSEISYSQSFYGKIQYKEIAKYARFGVFDATLEFNSEESLYSITPFDSKLSKTGDDSGLTVRVNLPSKNTKEDFFYKTSDLNVVKTHDDFLGTSVYFNDYAVQNWILVDSTKTIMNLTCHKAITEFRGRKYEAWYTLEIPVKFGPRNFHGLPGLMMELKEESGLIEILATSIKTKKTNDNNKLVPNEIADVEFLSIQEYRTLKGEIRLEKNKILSSKLPKGQTMDLDCNDCVKELELEESEKN